jgi:hypothetical protein
MNAIKNKLLYLCCTSESLLLCKKHRIQDLALLSADAYFNRKVKVGNSVEEQHVCTCVWFGGWFGTLETWSKALILSKSPIYSKLDSLAYYYGMRVCAYIPKKPNLSKPTP